jgi:hypothetical protein
MNGHPDETEQARRRSALVLEYYEDRTRFYERFQLYRNNLKLMHEIMKEKRAPAENKPQRPQT